MILVAGTFWVLMAVLLAWALFGHPRRVPAAGRAPIAGSWPAHY